MEDILYINSSADIRIREMVEIIPGKDKELHNLIILTILSAGANEITPVFLKDNGEVSFTSIDEIGTKFILDGKEITSDDFLILLKLANGMTYNFFGLQFEDSNEHILKISLTNSDIRPLTFVENEYLKKVTIGTSITSIGAIAFANCTGLTEVTIPDSVTEIGGEAFNNCSGLTQLNIPNSVTGIGWNAFFGCTSLTSVTIPNSVTIIGSYAFASCTGLTSVTIGNSVTTINNSAFSGCNGLVTITSLATTAPTIYNDTFQSIRSGGTLHVPAGSDYSAWISISDYYLGKYSWTKVEDA